MCNVLFSHVQSQRKVAVVVATSGIAALLLPAGKTAHARFKLPVHALSSASTSAMRMDSAEQKSSKRWN